MFRLTVILCAAIYVGMIVLPEPQGDTGPESGTVAARADFDPLALASAAVPISTATAPATLTRASGEIVEIAAVIEPAAVRGAPISVMPVVATPATPDAASPTEIGDLVYVTGSSVNMRSGPSTANAVVTALGYGAEAERIEDLGNGWVQIRELDSGRVGFMAGRFLSERRP